jgi:hypothetical protein
MQFVECGIIKTPCPPRPSWNSRDHRKPTGLTRSSHELSCSQARYLGPQAVSRTFKVSRRRKCRHMRSSQCQRPIWGLWYWPVFFFFFVFRRLYYTGTNCFPSWYSHTGFTKLLLTVASLHWICRLIGILVDFWNLYWLWIRRKNEGNLLAEYMGSRENRCILY